MGKARVRRPGGGRHPLYNESADSIKLKLPWRMIVELRERARKDRRSVSWIAYLALERGLAATKVDDAKLRGWRAAEHIRKKCHDLLDGDDGKGE